MQCLKDSIEEDECEKFLPGRYIYNIYIDCQILKVHLRFVYCSELKPIMPQRKSLKGSA